MPNIQIKLILLTTGGGSGPLYNGYYTNDGTTYILNDTNLSLPSVGSEVIVSVPDTALSYRLINTNVACGTTSSTTPIVTTTTTTTTITPTANVTIYPYNSLPGSSYTVYINGVADTGWKSGTRAYQLGTIIYINYAAPACGVLLDSVAYASGTEIGLYSAGATYYFELLNANNWSTTSYTCIGNVQYSNQINDCGNTRQIQTNPGSLCDCYCNQTCAGTYYGDPQCGTGEYGNAWVQYPFWVCSGNPTGGPPNVLDDCSCNCNPSCDGFTYTAQYCGQSGRVGTNPSTLYVDRYFACTGGYAGTDVIDDCSCTCNQTCDGEYWEYYCTNFGVSPYTQRRRQRYSCNGALTGLDEFVTNCSGDCGVDTTAVWQNDGGPYCGGAGGCTQFQGQNQVNPCNPQTYRTVNLGVSSTCGSWNLEYYCIGNAEWSRERNSCTNETRNDTLVNACSTNCGGSPGTYYELYGCTGEYAWTQIPPDGIGQRYVLPYPTEIFYTYSGQSSYFCTPPSGYNGSIQKTYDYYCP